VEDDCSICNESLPKLPSKLMRMTCCGKGTHEKCHDNIYKSSMSDEQKGRCIMCRTKHVAAGSKEALDRIRRWADKGKAWAQSMLGQKYSNGIGVDQSYQQARELYELSAIQGDADAQYNLGIMYERGQGVNQSYERAAEYYEAAARQGEIKAQYNLGVFYDTGKGVEQSFETAREWWMKSAEQGNASAQYSLGRSYATGEGVEQSFESAREWLMKAAEQGFEEAIKTLQQLDEFEGRTTPSFTPPKRCSTCDAPNTPTHKLRNCKCKSAQYCNATCQKSHWKSHKKKHRRLCKEMELWNTEGEMRDDVVVEEEEGETKETPTGELQQQGEGEDVCPVCIEPLQKNVKKFIRFTCCGKGIHRWCDEGIKVSSLSHEQKNHCPLCRTKYPDSVEEFLKQLRPWVEKGKAWAQSMLGDRYHGGLGKYARGVGVDQSFQRARELYELSASQGYASAQDKLGLMYRDGHGVDQSDERAKEYYEAAARNGYVDAQFKLGVLYLMGKGVEQSFETAREWMMKAAEQGSDDAIKSLQIFDEEQERTTPSFIPKPFECATCYRPHDPSEHKLRPCKRCHRVFYCGKECQMKHWKEEGRNAHKQKCNKKAK